MKLTDKRFWIFEVMMLLCGVATACVESLNYGLVRFISSPSGCLSIMLLH